MSATDELRRLLDEHGIKWEAPEDYMRDEVTEFALRGRFGSEWYCAAETYNGDALGLYAEWYDELTPADVAGIAQGREKCSMYYGEDDDGIDSFWCSACGCRQAATFEHAETSNLVEPRYCQNCGREVER